MRKRVVVPEILDSLPVDDPEAVMSRRDLRRVNALMGNFRWIERCLKERRKVEPVSELGAGEGCLAKRLAAAGYAVTAFDLAPKPEDFPGNVRWKQGDLLETFVDVEGAVVASLFLHHFEKEDLARLGALLQNCSFLCFTEPLRSSVALAEGYALLPFVNRVTKHDMIVSIRAGFRKRELPVLLGLDDNWQIEEETTLLGSYRMKAWRK